MPASHAFLPAAIDAKSSGLFGTREGAAGRRRQLTILPFWARQVRVERAKMVLVLQQKTRQYFKRFQVKYRRRRCAFPPIS